MTIPGSGRLQELASFSWGAAVKGVDRGTRSDDSSSNPIVREKNHRWAGGPPPPPVLKPGKKFPVNGKILHAVSSFPYAYPVFPPQRIVTPQRRTEIRSPKGLRKGPEIRKPSRNIAVFFLLKSTGNFIESNHFNQPSSNINQQVALVQ